MTAVHIAAWPVDFYLKHAGLTHLGVVRFVHNAAPTAATVSQLLCLDAPDGQKHLQYNILWLVAGGLRNIA